MARKTPVAPPPPEPQLRVSLEAAANKINERIALGTQLRSREFQTIEEIEACENDRARWHSYNTELLKKLFTTPQFAEEYSSWVGGMVRMRHPTPQERIGDLRENVSDQIHRLESIRDRLELIPVEEGIQQRAAPVARQHTNRAFIVHGHDEGVREAVARFIEQLGIDAIVLHEQPTEGRTIVEKIEHYADVDFAIVLLTPDDVGAGKAEATTRMQDRARQNVVLELGYFIGKLGRKHVCALYKGPLEMPSDFFGVGYVGFDASGGWRLKLARELRSAGFNVDMNQAL